MELIMKSKAGGPLLQGSLHKPPDYSCVRQTDAQTDGYYSNLLSLCFMVDYQKWNFSNFNRDASSAVVTNTGLHTRNVSPFF